MEISEELWNDLKKNTLSGVFRLLESAQKLLENNGEAAISAGLYTYAVEEYGKLMLLSKCNPLDGKVNIDYNALFGGRGSHDLKFEAAIEDLKKQDTECTIITKGVFDPAIFDPEIFDTTAPIIADFKAINVNFLLWSR